MNRKKIIIEWIEIILGTIIMSLGFYFFLSPNKIVSGGVTGWSLIFTYIIPGMKTWIFILIANIITLIIGLIVLGKEFFFKTFLATLLSPIIIFLFSDVLKIPTDIIVSQIDASKYLLSSVFGGLTMGLGLGIVLRNNGSTGGLDVIQKILNKYLRIPFSVAVYIVDGLTIAAAMFIIKTTLSPFELGMYGIITMIVMGLVIDMILIRGKQGYTAFIITDKSDIVKEAIYANLARGITEIKVIGGYSRDNKSLVICTIKRNQVYDLKELVTLSDNKAFSFIIKTNEIIGTGF